MAFSTSPLEVAKLAKDKVIDPRDRKTLPKETNYYQWWNARDEKELLSQLLSTTAFLKKFHSARIRQASIYSRLFSGKPLYNYLASTSTLDNSQQMPMGRPTANVVYSCIDTLTSKITQDKPQPVFLTNGAHYREQRIAGELNDFLLGEFHRTKAYELGAQRFRDAAQLGNGFTKVIKKDNKVELERTLETELLVDFNDGYYGSPRALIQTKLCDRGVLADEMPKESEKIFSAQEGTVDSSPQSTDTISDQIIVSEGWHRPSGKGAKDGRHTIVCSEGILLNEVWTKPYFPFSKLNYNENTVGYFSQGLAEILFPTQMEIYKMLIIASQCIEMVGVPRILISELSKVLETAFNNNVASIIKVKTMAEAPQFLNATSNNQEIYDYIKWLIENAYAISGVSALSAASMKEPGLTSGEALRTMQNVESDRFAALQRRYQDSYVDLSYIMIDTAADIAEETGSYSTVCPGKDGTREIDLPKDQLTLKDTHVIQCATESSLPKDPAGRQAKLSEMFAAQEIDKEEFRFLSANPDLKQSDQLAFALRERILHDLDEIVDKGQKGYAAPDSFILDPSDLATILTVQTINKYAVTDLEEEKMDLLRHYFSAIQVEKKNAMPPPMMGPAPGAPPQGAAPQQGLPIAPPMASQAPTSGVQV